MKGNGTEIAVVGVIPPPFGGVSVHIDRLLFLLRRNCIPYRLYELNGRSDADRSIVALGRSPRTFLQFLLTCKESIVHFHTDNGTAVMVATCLLRLRRRQAIFTLHSDALMWYYRHANVLKQWFLRSCLVHASHLIATNALVADWLRSLGVTLSRISVIPAFLPPSSEETAREHLPEEIVQFLGCHTPIIGSQAWFGNLRDGTDIYGLDIIADLVLRLREAHRRVGVYTVISGVCDAKHRERVFDLRDRLGLADNWMIIERNFHAASLYKQSNLFVRPTLTDGDSVSIRECLWLGVPVVASDAVQRPAGCTLFRTHDSAACVEAVTKLLGDLEERRKCVEPATDEGWGDQLVDVYRNIAGSTPHGRRRDTRIDLPSRACNRQ